jgi:hypothetical protein
MRKLALALAAVAALSITTPASAVILPFSYTFTTGSAGSGTFSIAQDTATSAITLTAFNYTLGATSFNTTNASLQPSGANFVIGGNVNGPDIVSSLSGVDDFSFEFIPFLGGAGTFTYYIGGGIQPVQTTNVLYLPVTTAPVPEPATWAMMLLGFGAIGFALRRQQNRELRHA